MERVKSFLKRLEDEADGYRSDYEMGYDTVSRHIGLLTKLQEEISKASEYLHERELVSLLDAVEDIYPLNFYSGTGYGTCYGTRQALDIIANVNLQYGTLDTEEVRIVYIKSLWDLYKIRARMRVIPVSSVLENRLDEEFPHGTINFMNDKIKSAKTLREKLEIMGEIVKEAHEHGYY